ncbi:MAG: hypothetical protein CSA70_09365 [Rhodobacterales bacterium]|nr:MAG: hypothetical protein CSA70_09365 [Rhodobacterales bacterium]
MTHMKPILAVLTMVALPGALLAATEIDADGDGLLSFEEVQAVFPDVTEAQFMAMDLNEDGTLNDEEAAAAEKAGLMVAPTDG